MLARRPGTSERRCQARGNALFAGIDHDFALVLEQINAQWPGTSLIGCTTDGEMSSRVLFAEDSLVLVLLSGADFHVVSGVASSVSTDVAGSIHASAKDAVRRLAGSGGVPRLCITMPDGLTVSGSAFLEPRCGRNWALRS